jgi:hypothetical protein
VGSGVVYISDELGVLFRGGADQDHGLGPVTTSAIGARLYALGEV